MNDEQYIDIAIEISKKAKYPYGAIVVKDNQIIGRSDDKTLMETNIDELAKFSRKKIEIIKELHRDKAVEVLRNHN